MKKTAHNNQEYKGELNPDAVRDAGNARAWALGDTSCKTCGEDTYFNVDCKECRALIKKIGNETRDLLRHTPEEERRLIKEVLEDAKK